MKFTAMPVMQTGISTLASVIALAFSDFEYVVKYFFWVYVMIICFGLFNGLIVLPSVLGLIGSDSDPDADKATSGTKKYYPPASAFSGSSAPGANPKSGAGVDMGPSSC